MSNDHRESIRGAIVAVGGGATVTTGDVEIVHQKIELHFHFHGEVSPTRSLLDQIKQAVAQASAALSIKGNHNEQPEFSTVTDMPALQAGNSKH